MKLSFQYLPTSGGRFTVVLADESVPVPPRLQRDAVSGYRPGGRCVVQDNPLPEAEALEVFSRHNRALSVPFQIERCHRTNDDAVKFCREELGLIGKRGTLIDHGPPEVRYTGGVMESVECLLLAGLTTIHLYTFRGGAITAAGSATYPTQL